MANYKEFLSYVGAAQKEAVLRDYEHVQKSIVSYMLIKTLISLATGLLTFTICSAFDISFAIFWGFIAFIFNFIPNIGSIASVILPLTMAFIQLEDFQIIIFFALLLVSIHFTIGNLIEPIIMGNRLLLNTPTVLIGLVFWGFIWGIPGMILSVPLLVITKIILDRNTEFSILGRLMGYPEKVNKKNPN